MSKDVSKIKVACVSLGCILSLPLLLVSILILELLFIGVMLELNKSRSREESKLIQKAQNQLEQLIRENRSEEAVDLMLNKEYWHKQNIKTDKIVGFWFSPIYDLSERYPEYSLALKKKCKILQADPLQRPLRNEIYCDSREKILENRQKFESVLEKLIINNKSEKALNLVIDINEWGPDRFWASQGVKHETLDFNKSIYTLANKHPAFQTAWKEKCRSAQKIVAFDPSIPNAKTKPQNNKGEIRLPPEYSLPPGNSQNLSAYDVWNSLYCDGIQDIYDW